MVTFLKYNPFKFYNRKNVCINLKQAAVVSGILLLFESFFTSAETDFLRNTPEKRIYSHTDTEAGRLLFAVFGIS